MRTKLMSAGVAALVLVAGGAAIAQSERPARNAERPVTQAEFIEARTARLVAMDADGDGIVTAEERRAAGQARMAERRGQMFTRLDTDNDGVISRAEWDAAPQMREGQMRGGQARGEHARGGAMKRGHRGPGMRHGAMSRVDRSGEPVTVEAVRQRAAEQFARLDADGDGVVTAQERSAHREARKAEWSERRAARQAERSARTE